MSIYFFKVGLFLHLTWTIFMFTETQLLSINLTKYVNQIDSAYGEQYEKMKSSI